MLLFTLRPLILKLSAVNNAYKERYFEPELVHFRRMVAGILRV